MIIKVNYTVSDIYMSTSVSPVYIKVVYSGTSSGGGGVWGTITGTLSAQTDLQSALDLKVPTSRTLTINGVAFDLSANRSWTIDTLPSQTGNSGKYLTTNGTAASWGTIVGMGIGNAITSATAGSVLFAGTSGVLQQDNANLFWDDTNNRLGIGTASPAYKLEVSSTSGTSTAGVLIKNSGAGVSDFASLNFTNDSTLQAQISATSSNFTFSPVIGANGFGIYSNGTSGITLLSENGAIKFAPASDGTLGSQKMTLFTNGNLSINTGNSDFGFKFNVNGTARVNGDFTTNLTQGSIPFIGTSGLLTQSNSNLFWDNANSRLGIGITSPLFKLDVSGTTRLNGDIRTNLNPNSVLFINAFGDIGQNTANFFWDNTNLNLGIGTNATSLTDSISIVGSSNARKSIVIQNTNTLGNASFYFQNNRGSFASYGGLLHGGATYATNFFGLSASDKTVLLSDGANSTGLMIGTLVSANLIFGTNNAERMRLTSAGRLLLGTTTESTFKLDVNGTARVSGDFTAGASAGLTYNDSTGVIALIKNQNAATNLTITNTNTGISASAAYIIKAENASAESQFGRYSLANSGYFAIKSGDTFLLHNSDSGGGIVLQTAGSANSNIRFATSNSSTAQMTLTAAGRLLIGTTTEGTNQLQVADTSAFGTNSFINKLNASFGTIGIQSYSVNNAWFGDNVFFNGTNFVRIASGYTGLFYFAGSEGQFRWGATGSAGTSVSNGSTGNGLISFKMNLDGTVAMGDLSNIAGNYTGANFIMFGSTKNIGINTTTDVASAKLHISSTTQGFLPPRMTTTQINAIVTPAEGLIAFNTTISHLCVYQGGAWVKINHSPM